MRTLAKIGVFRGAHLGAVDPLIERVICPGDGAILAHYVVIQERSPNDCTDLTRENTFVH